MKAEWSNKDSLEMPTTTSGDYIKREDVCYECKGYGDDYYINGKGEWVCACDGCPFNTWGDKDDE